MGEVSITRTQVDNSWVVRRKDHILRKTVQYKSDGKLFKEDRENNVVERKYRKQGHSHDHAFAYDPYNGIPMTVTGLPGFQLHNEILNHNPSYSLLPTQYILPWWHPINSIDDEITTSWTIEFQEDGTAKATINTRQIDEEWEIVKEHKPRFLNPEAA